MRMVWLLAVLGAWTGWAPATGHADTIVFRTDTHSTSSIDDDTLTTTLTDLTIDGVTFDAVLTVVGASTIGSDALSQNTSGVGVDGTRIHAGESLLFSMTTSNVSGGRIIFEGFHALDLNAFSTGMEADLETGGCVFRTLTTAPGSSDVDISKTAPLAFSLIGVTGGSKTTSFSVDDVTASFRAAPVPEPGTIALLSMGMLGMAYARRRGMARSPRAP